MLMLCMVPHNELASARFDTLQHALAPALVTVLDRTRISSTLSSNVGEQAEDCVT
jgi:hypothetical protein